MTAISFICTTCGTGYAPANEPPNYCRICREPRQYVPGSGQQWTTMAGLSRQAMNGFRLVEDGLMGIVSHPRVGIGQRALILNTPAGNILWDCISLLDEATVDIIRAMGGLAAIAISHPHYYTTMAEWSGAFGDCPVFLHADDKQWIMHPAPGIRLWTGETMEIAPGATLIRCGGHFAGGTVMHWASGGGGQGALLAGDIVMVIPDRTHVSFMRSYPNLIPLSAPAVQRIGAALDPYDFEVIYGPFFGRDILTGGKDAVRRSVTRYVEAVTGDGSAERQ
ncbi:MAG: MBL fold metallo-hydrolase [Hyphomicrobiales bacterium]|nr:MBL fold metallo-hydrolase [Hyphomicrobiales bacterium]